MNAKKQKQNISATLNDEDDSSNVVSNNVVNQLVIQDNETQKRERNFPNILDEYVNKKQKTDGSLGMVGDHTINTNTNSINPHLQQQLGGGIGGRGMAIGHNPYNSSHNLNMNMLGNQYSSPSIINKANYGMYGMHGMNNTFTKNYHGYYTNYQNYYQSKLYGYKGLANLTNPAAPYHSNLPQCNQNLGVGKVGLFPDPLKKPEEPKKSFVIKDIPEMTVENFLTNKNYQQIYFSQLKKPGEGGEEIPTMVVTDVIEKQAVPNQIASNSLGELLQGTNIQLNQSQVSQLSQQAQQLQQTQNRQQSHQSMNQTINQQLMSSQRQQNNLQVNTQHFNLQTTGGFGVKPLTNQQINQNLSSKAQLSSDLQINHKGFYTPPVPDDGKDISSGFSKTISGEARSTLNTSNLSIAPLSNQQSLVQQPTYTTVTNYNIQNYNFNNFNVPQTQLSNYSSQQHIANSTNNSTNEEAAQYTSSKLKMTTPTGKSISIQKTSTIPKNNTLTKSVPKVRLNLSDNISDINSNQDYIPFKSHNINPGGEVPESLTQYIARSFAKCNNDLERKKTDIALQKIISLAKKKGQLSSRNWNKFPLPKLTNEMEEMINNKNLSVEKNLFTELETYNNREKRKGRFDTSTDRGDVEFNESKLDDSAEKAKVIVGTCTNLEKQYLRLTQLPDPSLVRPEAILKKSLKMLKKKWKNKEADYNYINEQFRSIRQDMTIQHIKNDFTIKVYETHARIALENFDMDQFNQCQTQLGLLYKDGLDGSEVEFIAYKIIYTSLQSIKFDLLHMLKDIKDDFKSKTEIQHALKIRKILNENNYFELFKLYKTAPNMGQYLIQKFLPKFRVKALQLLATAYVQGIEVEKITTRLAFTDKEECLKFIRDNGGVLTDCQEFLKGKESLQGLSQSKNLIAPHTVSIETNM